jgi:ketosteroid isomerase-like protein
MRAAVAREVIEMFNREGSRAALEDWYAPDVVFVDISELPGGGEHKGREAAIAHLEGFFESWEDARIDVREILEQGDRMCISFVLSVTGRSSRLPTELDLWHVNTYRGDQVVRVEAYTNAEQALKALRGTDG